MNRPLLALYILVLFVLGVACSASSRTKALRVNLVALNAARDTTLAVSKERERQIVDAATSREEGRAHLDAWRARVDVVVAAIEVGYRAIHDAALLNDTKSASLAGALVAKALALAKELRP